MERFGHKRRNDRHGICSFGIRRKSKISLLEFGVEQDLTGDYREINYYVQYQKNNFIYALWNLFNTTGIETPMVFNYDKLTTTHYRLKNIISFSKSIPTTH
jgi:hypothetical protein